METVIAIFLILNIALVIIIAFETYFYRTVKEEYENVVEGLIETIQVVNSNADTQDLLVEDVKKLKEKVGI